MRIKEMNQQDVVILKDGYGAETPGGLSWDRYLMNKNFAFLLAKEKYLIRSVSGKEFTATLFDSVPSKKKEAGAKYQIVGIYRMQDIHNRQSWVTSDSGEEINMANAEVIRLLERETKKVYYKVFETTKFLFFKGYHFEFDKEEDWSKSQG
jgi:hypothetical protein